MASMFGGSTRYQGVAIEPHLHGMREEELSYSNYDLSTHEHAKPGATVTHTFHSTSSVDSAQRKHNNNNGIGFIVSNWRWELSTFILGTAASAVIVALLFLYKDEMLEEWDSPIQITTIVAALSTLAQSALTVSLAAGLGQLKWTWMRDARPADTLQTFDEASRGPYGSLLLLLKGLGGGMKAASVQREETGEVKGRDIRRKVSRFPRLAAIGALTVILMLAFSTFVQQSIAIVLRQYEVAGAQPAVAKAMRYKQADGTTTLAQSGSPGDLYMNDAVTSGLINTNSPSDINGNCTSERCEWDPYWTLAVCASVEEVTSYIEALNPAEVAGFPISHWNMSTARFETFSLLSDPEYSQTIQHPKSTTRSNMTIERRGTLSDTMVMYYSPCTPDWYDSHDKIANWKAYRAKMALCVQKLNSSFHDSQMHTTVLENKTDVAWEAITINGTQTYDICGSSPDGQHCVWEDYLSSAAQRLNLTLSGKASTAPAGDDSFSSDAIQNFVKDMFGPAPQVCVTNDTSLGEAGLRRRTDNIAAAMSNTMRRSPFVNETFGRALATTQFIQIRPLWLAYPAAVWVLTTIFLFGTIVHSSMTDVPLWKSSALAAIAGRQQNNTLRTELEVVKEMKSERMQLRRRGIEGWVLEGGDGR